MEMYQFDDNGLMRISMRQPGIVVIGKITDDGTFPASSDDMDEFDACLKKELAKLLNLEEGRYPDIRYIESPSSMIKPSRVVWLRHDDFFLLRSILLAADSGEIKKYVGPASARILPALLRDENARKLVHESDAVNLAKELAKLSEQEEDEAKLFEAELSRFLENGVDTNDRTFRDGNGAINIVTPTSLKGMDSCMAAWNVIYEIGQDTKGL